MNRTTVSLIAGTAALAAVTAFAVVQEPAQAGAATPGAASRLPVERTGLVCPAPSTSDLADTRYTSFTPVTEGTGDKGRATLTGVAESAQGGKTKPAGKSAVTPGAPGKPVTGDVSGGSAPALAGTAEGRYAPGWTLQATTGVAAGTGRGLLGLACGAPDTEFWFPGASTAADRTDYLHLTNPDDSAAVVDVELYGPEGALDSSVGDGITVPAHSSEPILLSTLSTDKLDDVTVHVNVRSGRVGAAVQALDDKLGGDWLTASTDPASTLVIPGIPKDATAVRLVAFTSDDTDADLKIQLASANGLITPAGHETLHIKAGSTTSVDLGDITRGEPGSLVLSPGDVSTPFVAAVRITRGKGNSQETSFIPATAPVGTRASVLGNTAKGTTLSVTAPTATAQVKVTASAGTDAGTAASKTYTVKAGTTQDVALPVPAGLKGTYALTVETLSGGPVYASRTLVSTDEDAPGFTTQTLPDDRGTVAVPDSTQDLSILNGG
ncbi:DUF5719 family protein [Streptomyces acidiscabies]|uniref:DUF5719 family protein n=5 Tax=Streptomyces acidiscabies TaxID=42234 RepID=A0AAP6BHP5_9ACTN|nr:DUF5719 family protein [Streptomyces acidiscabies]MBP5939226.1 hypothetical protein [Streptomyces sp. LBUM 1476]MBZ3910355.1 hypothetical protein [Streptomyces acidiscabies]MDX2964961.1 DUF5719 family protein [Streptomyces acidiscabies]MDX3024642.1 DUF5719 family protein [Streptomyces acidiscabies]MDX3796687.1 DUF5719 family protein [Streptomyces acidiscabies]